MVDVAETDLRPTRMAALRRWLLAATVLIVVAATVIGLTSYSASKQRREGLQQRRAALEKQQEVLESIRLLGGTAVVASETKVASDDTSLFCAGTTLFEEGTVLLVDVAGIAEFGDAELERLCKFAKPERLNLMGTAVTDEGLKAVAQVEQLEYLNLRNTAISDAGVKHLTRLRHLRELDLSGTHITDDSAVYSIPDRLFSLWLDGTEITDKGVDSLEVTAFLVSLADTRAGNSALKFRFAHLVNMRGLQIAVADLQESGGSRNVWWDLSDTAVTDEGIEFLKSSESTLKLNLHGTDVSEAALAELRQSLPECEVNGVSSVEPSAQRAAALKLADMAVANTLVGQPVAEVADLLELGYPTAEDIYAFDLGETTIECPIMMWVRTGEGYVLSVVVEAWCW